MGEKGKTMPAAERGLTVSDLTGIVHTTEAQREQHDRLAEEKEYLLGSAYGKPGADGESHAMRDQRIMAGLEKQQVVYAGIANQAATLEGILDREVRVPEPPQSLLVPDQYIVRSRDPKLEPILIPDMSDLTPQEIQRIAAGGSSPYLLLYPREYFEGIAAGRLPFPTRRGYYALVDSRPTSEQPATPLSEAVKVEDLTHTPIAEVRRKSRGNAGTAKRLMALPSDAGIRPLSVRETGVVDALTGEGDRLITNTRVKGTELFTVYDTGKGEIQPRNGNRNGNPSRLVVVPGGLRREVYLRSSRASRRAS